MIDPLALRLYLLGILCFWGIFLGNCSHIVDDYAVVIDAGSTGSRCFVFHVMIDRYNARNVSSFSCGKVIPGLSSFVTYPQEVASYIAPLLLNAANIVPRLMQLKTAVYVKATAGMRLLSQETQSIIWKNLINGLNQRIDIPFLLVKQNVGTIDGHEEAFFAVLASNYIAGSIDGNLHPIEGMPMLGALDMGGSSTQLIFYNGTNDARKVRANDFWSHSWLNYGVHRIHQRVLDYLYSITLPDIQHFHLNQTEKCENYVISNPCGFKGHRQHYLSHIIFEGTGEGDKCFHIIEQVIWPDLSVEDKQAACLRGRPCPIDEIEHPSVHGHHFYAMSVYYYALDCMRLLGPNPLLQWPTPTLEELEAAAIEFCGLEWGSLVREFKENKPHPYTREGQLQDRCFEALYIITLLEKGFAFDRLSRTITYALEVEGSEVEWTLGFALAEVDFRPHYDKPLLPTTKITWKYILYGALKGLFAPLLSIYCVIKSAIQTVEGYTIYAINKGRGPNGVVHNFLVSLKLI